MTLTDPTMESDRQTAAGLIRPLGALERLFYRYGERNPANFSIVAEFDVVLDVSQVAAALEAVRRRHPLMSAHVEDHPGTRLGFYHSPANPIPLRVISDIPWQSLAAEELSLPFDRSAAPQLRAVLGIGSSSSALVVTYEHTIADGISAVRVMSDLVAALNGQSLDVLPVPPSQESMLADVVATDYHPPAADDAQPDPRMLAPSSIRPFDGTAPRVHSVALNASDTARLVARCRTEGTTVHGAITSAASRVRRQRNGDDFVRVLSPINFRSLIGADRDCAAYFSTHCTGMAPGDDSSFWDQARAAATALAVARSASGVLAASAATEQGIDVDADADTAESLFTTVLPFELVISNLGVQDLPGVGPIRPVALWGPVLETQIAQDTVIGVTTYEGVLRMVACGYAPTTEFLDDVAVMLQDITR